MKPESVQKERKSRFMTNKKSLGKGLDALFADASIGSPNTTEIDINKIEPNENQPRTFFDDEKLAELAESIKTYGIIQPIIVNDDHGFYTIIAGERRWRAARIAGAKKIPVIIKDISDLEAFETALIENIQRTDLNPVEEAVCYKRLVEEYGLTQEQLAQKLGKNRSLISNSLRLLNINEEIKKMLIDGRLTMGHARVLLPVPDEKKRLEMANKICDEDMNVRETERMVGLYLKGLESPAAERTVPVKPFGIKEAEKDLQNILNTKVNIKNSKNKGKIEIEYYSDSELDRLLVFFKGKV